LRKAHEFTLYKSTEIDRCRSINLAAGNFGSQPRRTSIESFLLAGGIFIERRLEMAFLILEGESQDEFVDLLTNLSLKYSPCGPDQEDCVYTMAKCIARKRRSDKFLKHELEAAKLDPTSTAYDEEAALKALLEIVKTAEKAEEVERALQLIDSGNSRHLRMLRPRMRSRSDRTWIKAVVREIETVLLPRAARLGPSSEELRGWQAATVLNESHVAAELDFERQNDAIYDRAFSRLQRLQKAERNVSYAERLRFYRTLSEQAADVKP
jgi:hypothetical protein